MGRATRGFAIASPYKIVREIGKGAYGTVFLAKGPAGFVALKLCVKPEEGDASAYFREQRGIEKYISLPPIPGIVAIHKLVVVPNGKFFFYVMDLADDEHTGRAVDPEKYKPKTLVEILTAEVALSVRDSLKLGIRLAATLEMLQQRHLAHRDIKPGNILIVNGEAVLADIGLVADMRESSSIVGTPGYEPPEHHGTPQGDVFSLGRTLYRVCTGRSPDEAGFSPCKEAEAESPFFWRLLVIANKACAEDQSVRYRSAKGMLKDLRALSRKMALAKFRPWGIAGLAIAIAGVIAFLVIALISERAEKRKPSKADLIFEKYGINLEQQIIHSRKVVREQLEAAKQAAKEVRKTTDDAIKHIQKMNENLPPKGKAK